MKISIYNLEQQGELFNRMKKLGADADIGKFLDMSMDDIVNAKLLYDYLKSKTEEWKNERTEIF